jgi:hypothetical protein
VIKNGLLRKPQRTLTLSGYRRKWENNIKIYLEIKRNTLPCARHEGIWGHEDVAQFILNFGIRWK